MLLIFTPLLFIKQIVRIEKNPHNKTVLILSWLTRLLFLLEFLRLHFD